MSFSRRFVIIFLLIITLVTCMGLGYLQHINSTQLEVKTLAAIRKTPKVKLLPSANKTKKKADISNAPINSKIKQPVVIKI
jgi:hypothetical protein